jgi:opacity protein-like surface antigen
MTGKFAAASAARVLSLTILFAAQGFAGHAFAQTSPAAQAPDTSAPASPPPAAQQPPAAPSSSDQEPADESSSQRRVKPRNYKNWTFDVGAGANLNSGTTKTYVRGGGPVVTAGVARNANKYLGLRADFLFADIPLRDSSLRLAQAGSATDYLFALTLDPIINIPITKDWGGYILLGPGYYHRSGSLSENAAVPGSPCNGFWTWWGACPNVSIPLSGSFTNSSLNQFGYNVGAGITRKTPSGVEIYLEYRRNHGSSSGITTDVHPITLGFRW